MKIISKTIKLLPIFLLVLGLSGCSDDDDGTVVFVCTADAGTLTADATSVSLLNGTATISATANGDIVVPANYEVTYVLTSGTNLVIQAAGANPNFTVTASGLYTIHTLVAETSDNTDPNFLDLSVINFGTTTGGDVLNIVTTNNLCASLDVTGAPIDVLFTVVELAIDSGLTSLAAALTATNLVGVLQGDGPFTVFAPDNDAFTTLLNDTGLDLDNLTTEQEALVTNILLNHVIIGSTIASTDLIAAGSGYTNTAATGPNSENLSLYYNTGSGNVVINGQSTVSIADNTADNGIVHIVDTVIGLPTIATFATTNDALSVLVDALEYADTGSPTVPWINTVSDATAGPFTIFAPVNDAFTDPTNGVLAELGLSGFGEGMGELNAATTDAVLTYHVVNGANVQSDELMSGTVTTLGGDITADATNFTLTDANGRVSNIVVALVDIQAINGVVHVIDKVILPAP